MKRMKKELRKQVEEATEEVFRCAEEQAKKRKNPIDKSNKKTKYEIVGDFNIYNKKMKNAKVTRVLILDSDYDCFGLGDDVVAFIDGIPYDYILNYGFRMILIDSAFPPEDAKGLMWESEPSFIGKTIEFKEIKN